MPIQQKVMDDKRKFVSNKEITTGKWKTNLILKVFIGIFYGVFFGFLPISLSLTQSSSLILTETVSMINLIVVSVLSLGIIFWLFKGDVKKKYIVTYSLIQIINSFLLVVALVTTTVLYPLQSDIKRYFVLSVSIFSWSIIMVFIILFVFLKIRKKYPLSGSKTPYAIISFILLGLIEPFIYLARRAELLNSSNGEFGIFLLISGILCVFSIVIFFFGMTFVKRYRDVLLGDRTEYEIDSISNWESAKIFSLITSASGIFTYSLILFLNNKKSLSLNLPLYIELIIDFLLVVAYLSLILVMKFKYSKKSFYFSRIFKSIDNSLMMDLLVWIIVAKTTLLQGFYLNNNSLGLNTKTILLLISSISIIIIYGFSTIVSFNVPNLRNTATTLPILLFAIVLGLFIVFFGGYLQKDQVVSKYIYLFMPLILLIGLSISLIIKIGIVSKIFKVKWVDKTSVYDELLIKEQLDQEISIDKEIEVDEQIEDAEEISFTK